MEELKLSVWEKFGVKETCKKYAFFFSYQKYVWVHNTALRLF